MDRECKCYSVTLEIVASISRKGLVVIVRQRAMQRLPVMIYLLEKRGNLFDLFT